MAVTGGETVLEKSLNDPVYKKRLFEALGYETFHHEVERFHNSRARVKVTLCPRRSSKSYSAAHEMIPSVLMPNTVNWVVGPSYSLAEKEFRVIHENLVLKRDKIGLPKPKAALTNPRSGQLYIRFPWGSVLEGKSADRPDSLLGEATNCVIYSEAAQLGRNIRERYVMQTVITCNGTEIVPTTPMENAEWVNELYDMGQTPNDYGVESFHWDITANPKYPMEEFERAKKMYGENSPVFREQYLGERVFYAGRVYPTFQPETHVIEPFEIPGSWRRIRGIDFGHRDPFVCLWAAVGPEGELYFYREYYCREGRSIREHANEIKAKSRDENIVLTVADPSGKQAIEDMAGERLFAETANNDRYAGRTRVLEYLLPTDDGPLNYGQKLKSVVEINTKAKPRLYIFNNLQETVREFIHYRWKEGQSREGDKERTEGEDHSMDTVRYIVMTRPSPFKERRKKVPGTFDWWSNKANAYKQNIGYIGNGIF